MRIDTMHIYVYNDIESQEGSHRHYVHPVKPGKVTIPFHSKELSKIVEKSIRKQAGLDK